MINRNTRIWLASAVLAVGALTAPSVSLAQPPGVHAADATRYLALGDSIAAGYKVVPVTQAYPYLLYQGGVFDHIPSTLFCNAAVPGATSQDVLLHQLRSGLPEAKIFVANQYTIPEIEAVLPLTGQIIGAFNGLLSQVVGQFPNNVYVVDVHQAFLGRQGLLLVERHASSPFETHLTTAGHRVMEQAFADVIGQNK
jgi:hypothetical protein